MPVAERHQTTLEAIVDVIVDVCRPNRIILFGSRARGDARDSSDHDVAVELAVESDKLAARSAIASALAQHKIYKVDVHVRSLGEIERKMHDVGWIDYDIGREGIVVYLAGVGAVRRHLAPALRVREGTGGPPESAALWIERANEDLRSIEITLGADDPIPWTTVCFHAQQAAEKYLKALVVQRNIRPERTHDLTDLLLAVRTAAGYALEGVDDDCKYLKQFAVDPRYPEDQPIPGEATGRRAADAVQRIVDAVKPLLVVRTPRTPPQ